MARPFEGKSVIVTGSSRGIGRETALLFGILGAQVMLNGRDASALERSAAYLADNGVSAATFAADITDADDCTRLVDACVDHFGKLDVLVNNAGLSMRGRFSDLVPDVANRIIKANLTGTVLPTLAALPALKRTKGSIIFVSTLAAIHGFPGVSVYSAAKMSLTALSQSLEAELRSSGIHVGVAYLPFVENDADKRSLAADGSMISVKRRFQLQQSQAAHAIVRMVRSRRRRAVPGPTGKALVLLERACPLLVQWVMNRSGGRIHLRG